MVKKKANKSSSKKLVTPLPQVITGNFEVLPTPTKSHSDKKEYKVIRLENGLTACLISDLTANGSTKTKYESESSESESDGDESASATDSNESEDESDGHDKRKIKKGGEEVKLAAAALCVGVGSFSDPKEVPGLAHFLEHMVFMGSKKFPKENDFDSYIKKHGGSDNAATDYEKTTFYLECFEKYLYKSMDKFAQFFISPLMNKESMTRERESVESEFQNSVTSDEHRKEQLLVSFAQESSPVNNFSWGNMVTLKDNVDDNKLYDLLHEFRQQHYSAHRMTLAVQARLPLKVLELYVVNCFSQVPNNKLPAPDFKSYIDVFSTPQFKKTYYVKPVKNLHQVELTWMLPPTQHLYRSKPADYVSWLLLHEGPGSLLSYLKNKLWALAITGECDEITSSIYTHFSINITLTPEGLLYLAEVIQAVFSYIKMLKEVAPDERIFKELQLIGDMDFRFQEEDDACSIVEDLSENMHYYPPEDYLTGPDLYFEYKPKEIANIINALVPENMNMIVMASSIPYKINYDKIEPWFKTKYCELDFKDSWMKMWKDDVQHMPEFHLPNPNLFIADDFSLIPGNSPGTTYPIKVLDSSLMELWYKGDDKFKLPFAYYYYYFITPYSIKSVKSACLLDIFVLMLNTNLAEEGYDAIISGLDIKISGVDKGIVLNVSGYNQKLPDLINLIAQYLGNASRNLQKDLFAVIKEKLGQVYNNKILKPSVLCRDIRLSILQHDYITLYDKLAIVNEITFEDMVEFSSQVLKNVYVKCLVQGNVAKSTAQDTTTRLIDTLKCEPMESADFPQKLIHEIPNGEHCCRVMSFNKQSPSSMITNYYQTGLLTLKDNAIADIILLLIEEPLFDILRTKEQLGYNVSHSIRDTYGVLGFSITVQAQINKFKTDYIDSRIEAFLLNQYTGLKSKGKQKFAMAQRGLIKLKQCVDVDLDEEVSRNWGEIITDKYMFDRMVQEVKVIEELKFEEVLQWWYKNSTCNKESQFRKITFQVVGHLQSNTDDKPDAAEASDNEIIANGGESETFKLELFRCEDDIKKGADYFVEDFVEFKKKLPLLKL